MSLLFKSQLLEEHCISNNIKCVLIESSLETATYLVEKVVNLSIVDSVAKYGSKFKVVLKEFTGTGGVAMGTAGHWEIIPNHPGLGGKFKNLRKKNGKNKKGIFSPFANKKDANKSHIVGTMNNNGLLESQKRFTQVILESFKTKNPFYNNIKKIIDIYWNSKDSNTLVQNLQENVQINSGSDDIRTFSKHILDIITGFGVQTVNSNTIDEQDIEFLYKYASERVV